MSWLAILRCECESTSQARVAKRLGVSQATISQVLKGTYGANTTHVEARVRGSFMGETLVCPVLGEISKLRCQEEQRRPFAATTPQRVAVFRACRSGCANQGGQQ